MVNLRDEGQPLCTRPAFMRRFYEYFEANRRQKPEGRFARARPRNEGRRKRAFVYVADGDEGCFSKEIVSKDGASGCTHFGAVTEGSSSRRNHTFFDSIAGPVVINAAHRATRLRATCSGTKPFQSSFAGNSNFCEPGSERASVLSRSTSLITNMNFHKKTPVRQDPARWPRLT